MALPPGFELEQPVAKGIRLPSGFELEPAPPAAAIPVAPPSEIPAPRRAISGTEALGRAAASLADVTVGGVIPAAVQTVAYPVLRAIGRQSPEEAAASTQRMVRQVESPFGKLFGVQQTPEYQAEASRQIMDFIGQNIQKGSKWLAEKTGLPQADVENMASTLMLTAPKAVPAVARGVQAAAESPWGREVRAGVQLPFEPALQARRERLSAESYARGPQIDAAKDAQRLGLALNPVDVQPTVGPRASSMMAGTRGEEAIQQVNRPKVNDIARREMGLPADAMLNGPQAFDAAKKAVAGPYDEVRKISVIQADDAARQALNNLRPSETLIGAEATSAKINALIDSAMQQVDAGMSGAAFIDNISKLRKDAKRIHRNKNAGPDQIDLADTNLAIANVLEGMLDNNIANPKLRQQYQAARQQMAKIYAYETATDFNTGFVDPSKIARLTAKDNALTGDLAAIGRVAGNFPDAFKAQTGAPWYTTKVSRAGFGGAGGAVVGGGLGSAIGLPVEGTIIGTGLGALLGELGSKKMAARIASPEYQAGLQIRDYRIPVNRLAPEQPLAPPTPGVPALYDWRNALVSESEMPYRPNFVFAPRGPEARFVGPQEGPPQLAAPSAEATMATLRAEEARRAGVSRAIGQEAEAKQAAAEAAARKPAAREVMLELDPVTGKLREASQGVRGATPETFRNFGADLASAAEKVTAGKRFDLTAAEKVAWERTKIDLAEVAPGFKSLTDKAIAEKMMDRQWVEAAVARAQEKAAAFEQIAARAKDAQARRQAMANRERMLDTLEALQEQLQAPRPIELGGQGPKTRAARNRLAPGSESVNKLAP